jgi:indolepyruvate ferredoxin oxidoreductase beta subunit
MNRQDVLMAGVGGQGIILASDIVCTAALACGYDVKKTDTLGMAQRGGSVISHIRLASQVYSPLIREGEVDILVAFEKLEAARWAHFLRPGGLAIVNNHSIPPQSVSLGGQRYPSDEEIRDILKSRAGSVLFVPGTQQAMEMGNVRVLNIFMLGYLSRFMPLKVRDWKDCISQYMPENILAINLAAFDRGRREARSINPL